MKLVITLYYCDLAGCCCRITVTFIFMLLYSVLYLVYVKYMSSFYYYYLLLIMIINIYLYNTSSPYCSAYNTALSNDLHHKCTVYK